MNKGSHRPRAYNAANEGRVTKMADIKSALRGQRLIFHKEARTPATLYTKAEISRFLAVLQSTPKQKVGVYAKVSQTALSVLCLRS